MKRGARRLLVSLCLAGAVSSAACLLVLRSGRPLYYTNGGRSIRATELVDAPMLVYDTPEPVTEIPGPLRGRVEELPDGRLIYGRSLGGSRTDLVIFDPNRPELAPVAASILNSTGHELSPALTPEGMLYFASNRAGGAGGFDIYAASYIEGGLFSVPRRLPGTVNSIADEVDPAPNPVGTELVFVRRLPAVDEGRTGHLMIARLNSDADATPLWKSTRGPLPLIDREPAFSPDGVSLWFVREEAGAKPRLRRTWRHLSRFVDPIRCPRLDINGPFRAPRPTAGGFRIGLVRHGDVPLLYLAKAREVYPWWPGQGSLEFFLFLSLLTSLFLLMLLLLGARWHQLDFITWCLILSLLLHLLIWMLLSGVEMVRGWSPSPSSEDRLSVRLVSLQKGSHAGGGELSQHLDHLAQRLTMPAREDRILDEVPQTALPAKDSRMEVPGEGRSLATLQPARIEPTATADDDTETYAPFSGRESLRRVSPEALSLAQAESDAAGQRAETALDVIEVSLPGVEALPSASQHPSRVPDLGRAKVELLASPRQQKRIRLADAPRQADVRPSEVSESLARAGPPAETKVVAAELSMQAEQRSILDAGSAAFDAARPTPRDSMVAAARRSPPAHREVETARPERGQRVRLGRVADGSRAVPSQNRSVEPALPTLATSSALHALDPGRVGHRLARMLATTDSLPHVVVPAPTPTLLPPPERYFTEAMRSSLALRPRPRGVSPVLRDAAEVASTSLPTGRVSGEATSVPQPGLAAVSARPSALSVRRRIGDPPIRSVAWRLATPPQRELPRPRHRDPASRRRLSQLQLHLHAAWNPNLAIHEADLIAQAPVKAADPVLRTAMVIGPLAAIDRQPDDLLRPTRGGGQDDGFDRLSAGLHLPPSYLAMAPRVDTTTEDSKPAKLVSLYSNRFGPRKTEALARFGGTEATEHAVGSGLAYLASIQKRSGYWGSRRRSHEKYGEVYIGKTALCMLAFLGAGHTHRSDSEYSTVVGRAIDFLLSQQDQETGHFGRRTSAYSHGISTYALAECYAITGDPKLRRPLELAVTRILNAQSKSSDRRNRGGWGYFSATLSPEDPYSRTSVSSWMVMALKSAELSGITFPDASKKAVESFFWRMFDADRHYFFYTRDPSRLRSAWRTLPASTPASIFSLLLLGADSDDARLRGALQFTTDRAPKSYRRGSDDDFVLSATGNVYFWYYGSLASFMAGGEVWTRWNERLRTVLPRAQNLDGSFSPIGAYASYAGDTRQDMSYTTAMVVLSLEVYYRYFTPLLEGR